MKRAICLMTLVSGGLVAGCGDDDSTPETPIATPTVQTPAQLSKEQFITQGDGFCAEVNAALGSISSSTSTDPSSQTADLYEGMIEHLRGLGTPDDDAGLDDFYSAAEDLVTAEEEADAAAAATAQSSLASAASAYGFEDCGQGPTTTSTSPTAPSTAAPVVPAAPVTPTVPVAPAPTPGSTGAGGGTAGSGGGSGGSGGTSGSGGVGPG